MKRTNSIPSTSIGLPRRLGAIVYDLLLLFAILLVTSLPWVVSGIQQGQTGYTIYRIFIYTLIPLYYIGFWVCGGQTLGMKTWRIRVVDRSGNPIGWRTSLLRMIYAILSTTLFGLGFIHSFFDKQNRTWHDILSHSRLISVLPLTDKNLVTKIK